MAKNFFQNQLENKDQPARASGLLSIDDLSSTNILAYIKRALEFAQSPQVWPPQKKFSNSSVALLFFEPSTRTRLSFQQAAQNLGFRILNLESSTSSTTKGESLLATVRNISALGCRLFVIRHPESHALKALTNLSSDQNPGAVINAGDGTHEHPSQALLDLATLFKELKINTKNTASIKKLRLLVVGDILHSRVARSHIKLASILGYPLALCGPSSLLPEAFQTMWPHIKNYSNLDEAYEEFRPTAIMGLRIQKERMSQNFVPSFSSYRRFYGLTEARIQTWEQSKTSDFVILHPGPWNEGIEIDGPVVDHPRSLIYKQVSMGVFLRMALLEKWGTSS